MSRGSAKGRLKRCAVNFTKQQKHRGDAFTKPQAASNDAEKAAPQPEYPAGLRSVAQRGLKFLQLAGNHKRGGGDDGSAGSFAVVLFGASRGHR